MKNTIILFIALALSHTIKAQNSLPPKYSKVFVVSADKGAVAHGNDELNYWGYWQVVDKKEDAGYVINYRIKRIHTYSFKGYAQISDAKTDKVIFTTKKENTTWSMGGYNHKLVIIKKLTSTIKSQVENQAVSNAP